MSKSLGNLVWARELLEEHSPDAVRILTSSHPYDETWEYDASELVPADALAGLLVKAAQATGGEGPPLATEGIVSAFEAAMDENLNTRGALQVLEDLATRIVGGADKGLAVAEAQATLRGLGSVFGLRFGGEVEARARDGWSEHIKRFLP